MLQAATYPQRTNRLQIHRLNLRKAMDNADLERILNIVSRFIISLSIGALSGYLLISGSADVKAIGGALLGSITTYWFSPQAMRPSTAQLDANTINVTGGKNAG
jgi:hypothetical protein